MLNQFSRTELLLGKEALDKLAGSRVAVFGIGGVGGYVCEALVRSGVGEFDLVDDDKVCLTNLNRQIIATRKTIGKYKVEVMRDRILEINPDAKVNVHKCFFLPENADEFPFEEYDYIVDAVDTVTAKISLVMAAKEKNVPIISSMGAGIKLDPSQFKVADIYKTKVCPLAKVMRRELKKRRVKKLKVVYSEEEPIRPLEDTSDNCNVEETCQENLEYKAAKTVAYQLCNGIEDAGEVLLLASDSNSEAAKERLAGFQEEIKSGHPNVQIVDTIYCDQMDDLKKEIAEQKNAAKKAEEPEITADDLSDEDVILYYMEQHPNLKGMFGTNVTAVQLGLSALKEAEKTDEIVLTGFDAGEAQIEALKNGEIEGLAVQNPFGIGYASVVAAARSILQTGNEALVDTGYVWVTADNMNDDTITPFLYE